MIKKFKKETPRKVFTDEIVCLRFEKYVFKCGDDSKYILKGICKSQSKNIIFEENYICLFRGQYQKK